MDPELSVYDPITEALVDCMLSDYPTAPRGFYYAFDINELSEDEENEDTGFTVIGLGDLFYFNLMLLFVIPLNSSIITKGWIAFICIIVVQLGNLCTNYIPRFDYPNGVPAVPFPTVLVTTFAVALDAMGQYSDTDCEILSTINTTFRKNIFY